ncbi:hypothetical protein CTAYLR_008118 [Chrysophaeum taylorii]|uniref:Uncharacterized protein n=1 Tax=Chrysophaeum taylorii TaxID=2483200 RepID=A0AAD7UMC2_9STRA|nr:hypothetical protein CTAYLR_008118 [Chrysophaeum taylorii]
MTMVVIKLLVLLGLALGFVVPPPLLVPHRQVACNAEGGPLGFFKKMSQEIDNMVDDAMMKKLGNGDAFYGKRKSNFYGANDKGKRQGPDDNAEYNGPKGGSYFKLDRDGRPVTRRGTPLYDVDK